jgi:hypothetical protein
MSRFVDAIITYRILKKLTTPFDETEAYRLGIIDAQGKVLKKWNDLNSVEERDAYTILDRMIFRLKRIIQKVPVENRRISSYAAALSLVREHHADAEEYVFLERDFIRTRATANDLQETTDYLHGNSMLTFKMYTEEIANVAGGGFSSQATATPNPNLAGRDILLGKKLRRRQPGTEKIAEAYLRPSTYPDGKAIPASLPDLYQPASHAAVPKNQRCDNCEYYVAESKKCTRWNNAVVKPAYWCAKWDNIKAK